MSWVVLWTVLAVGVYTITIGWCIWAMVQKAVWHGVWLAHGKLEPPSNSSSSDLPANETEKHSMRSGETIMERATRQARRIKYELNRHRRNQAEG